MIITISVKDHQALMRMGFRVFYWEKPKPKPFRTLQDYYKREHGESFLDHAYEGFCFNQSQLTFFYETKPCNAQEQILYNKILPYIKRPDLAVIIYIAGDIATLKHEMSHAFLVADKSYEKTMRRLVKQLRVGLRDKMKYGLEVRGYLFPRKDRDSDFNLDDEIQAFSATSNLHEARKIFRIPNLRKSDILPFATAFNRKKSLTRTEF